MSTTAQALIKYQGPSARERDAGWRSQVDMAASHLAAVALNRGRAGSSASRRDERLMLRFLDERVAGKRRAVAVKCMVVTLAATIGVAAGVYIGALS